MLLSPYTWLAIWAMTVVLGSSIGMMWKLVARNVMPMNRTARIEAITISVRAALRASGGLNAGTPVAIASVPVRATAPGERAQQDQDRHVLRGLGGRGDDLGRRRRARVALEHDANEPHGDHQERRAEEQVGRDREDVAGLPQAAQVAEGDQADREDGDLHPVRVEGRDGR